MESPGDEGTVAPLCTSLTGVSVATDTLSEPMRDFLKLEKNIYPVTPQRVAVDDNGEPVCGRQFATYRQYSDYGPERPASFALKGIWLTESECTWVAVTFEKIPQPFKRDSPEGPRILFLIHPESESLYAPLLRKHEKNIKQFQAISLSSVRSLLVDIPDENGGFFPFFVKLSVNAMIGNLVRVLTEKECISSIGNACILENRHSADMAFMRDLCAFIPVAGSIDPAAICGTSLSSGQHYGMIVREIPDFLLRKNSPSMLVPMFALFHDNGMLEGMVAASAMTVSDFLCHYLLIPYARAFVDLLFFHHISIQSHGQNLLWVISRLTGLPLQLIYRDMGGVNLLLPDSSDSPLPPVLSESKHYYQDTHLADATDALEHHWIAGVLFNLTKRLARSEHFRETDPVLGLWHAQMQHRNLLCNWNSEKDPDPYRHQETIPIASYMRYGHVEDLFKICLMAQIKARQIPHILAERYDYMSDLVGSYETQGGDQSSLWFQPLIHTLYSHWLCLRRPQND